MTQATGRFEVQLTPQAADESIATANLPRMLIDKTFLGDLEATSMGQMVAAMTAVEGSAAYVAMERVSGTLHGRRGSFVLQHSSTMNRNVPTQRISVVPDSGTDELIGLSGQMMIDIVDGDHLYTFDYVLTGEN